MKTALITGFGVDSTYLSEFLLKIGYIVHVTHRTKNPIYPESFDKQSLINNLSGKVNFHQIDLLSPEHRLTQLLEEVCPDEIYHLAAQSHVGESFNSPLLTMETNTLGTLRLLEAIRSAGLIEKVKLYNASTSEMFGDSPPPQDVGTEFRPNSPYAVSKVAAHNLVDMYRKTYGLKAWNGIMFNHESPRRHPSFVSRKITLAACNMMCGNLDFMELGNLDAKRDWGYAPEYVEAMWYMLQSDQPTDYVIGTGQTHTVEEFLNVAFDYVSLPDEKRCVHFSKDLVRPRDVPILQANMERSTMLLGWKPRVDFGHLVEIMIDADMEYIGMTPYGYGFEFLRQLEEDGS